ncbi:MAG: outer membrane beta-barrel protein [bacterium]
MGIKGQDTYSSLKRDEREPLVASNTIKFNDFSVTPYFEQEIGKRLKTTISYTFSERKYDQEDENLEGSKTYCGAIDLYYNLSRSIALDGEYTYTLNNFTETTPDRTEREIAAGFTWKRGSGIRASGKCGYAWEMEESGRRNNHPIMNSTLDIHPWIGTMVTATYSKSSSHASTHDTENDSFISHTASLNIRHDLLGRKVTVNYGGTYNLSDYDSVDREDKSLSGIVRIDWAMLNSVLLFLSGTYKRDRYIHNLTERRDKIYGSEGCLELKVSKSTTLALSGSYTQSRYQPDSYQVKLYDRSVKLAYSLNKSTLFEAGYQCLESVSDDQKLQPSEEDRANYQRKRCSAALRTNF